MGSKLVPFSVTDLAGMAETLAARLPITHADQIGAFSLGWMFQIGILCENSMEGGRLRAKVIEAVPDRDRDRLDNDLTWLKNGPSKSWTATDAPAAAEILKRVATVLRCAAEAATEKQAPL